MSNSDKKPLITLPGIAWDPHGISVAVREAVQNLGVLLNEPVPELMLNGFQHSVIAMTPTSQRQDLTELPVLALNQRIKVVYDNGVHRDTKPYENTPALVVTGVTQQEHTLGPRSTTVGRYAWVSRHTFRLEFDGGQFALGRTTLLQRPLKSPLTT